MARKRLRCSGERREPSLIVGRLAGQAEQRRSRVVEAVDLIRAQRADDLAALAPGLDEPDGLERRRCQQTSGCERSTWA